MKKVLITLLTVSLFSIVFAKSATKDVSVVSSASNIDNAVKLEWAQSGTVEVKMITARGQVIKLISRMNITAGSTTSLSLEDISNGFYYVTINTGRSVQKISFVK